MAQRRSARVVKSSRQLVTDVGLDAGPLTNRHQKRKIEASSDPHASQSQLTSNQQPADGLLQSNPKLPSNQPRGTHIAPAETGERCTGSKSTAQPSAAVLSMPPPPSCTPGFGTTASILKSSSCEDVPPPATALQSTSTAVPGSILEVVSLVND